jgi:hypothetical protein
VTAPDASDTGANDASSEIYVIVAAPDGSDGPPGEPIRIPFIQKSEPVPREKLLERFGKYTALAEDMMAEADKTAKGFRVDEITFHLGVSTDVGIAFVGQAGIEAGIDITLKRHP